MLKIIYTYLKNILFIIKNTNSKLNEISNQNGKVNFRLGKKKQTEYNLFPYQLFSNFHPTFSALSRSPTPPVILSPFPKDCP